MKTQKLIPQVITFLSRKYRFRLMTYGKRRYSIHIRISNMDYIVWLSTIMK